MSADKALPDPRALAALSALMALIADADGAQARLEQIMAITAEARTLIDQANAAKAELDEKLAEQRTVMAREKAAHDKRLAAERSDHAAKIAEREAATAATHAKAKIDADEAAKLKDDWSKLINRAVAA
jgi:hypothetical protein